MLQPVVSDSGFTDLKSLEHWQFVHELQSVIRDQYSIKTQMSEARQSRQMFNAIVGHQRRAKVEHPQIRELLQLTQSGAVNSGLLNRQRGKFCQTL